MSIAAHRRNDGASARAGIQADSLAGLVAPTVTTRLDTAGVP